MRQLIVYCDGGFGNRFNALVSGLLIGKRTGRQVTVVWPVNNWCGAAYSDLFDLELHVVDRELVTFSGERSRYDYLMVEDRLGLSSSFVDPGKLGAWDELERFDAQSTRPVFYYTALVPAFISEDEVAQQVRQLRLQSSLTQRASRFLAEHSLGRSLGDFIGVQIRKTDFGAQGADDVTLHELVQRTSSQRFFVCSDDAQVEERFSVLPNVAIHRKRAHVEKLIDGGWNAVTVDHSGRHYPFNVNRGRASVEDAVVDLLILSQSRIVMTSGSTFLRTALRMQAADLLGLHARRAPMLDQTLAPCP
jgi:hypothetical protein